MVQWVRRKAGTASWADYGLLPSGRRSRNQDSSGGRALPRERRFRQALEDRGGLFAIFGLFLAGRADLLPSPYLQELRSIKTPNQGRAAGQLTQQLGDQLSSFHLIHVAACSEVYRAAYQHRPIVIEFYHPDASVFDEAAWDEFFRAVRVLDRGPEAAVAGDSVIERFGHWLRMQRDIERKRMLMSNLRAAPVGIISRFPELIPALQSAHCLAYDAVPGRPLEDDLRLRPNPARTSLRILIECLLEQSLLLSLIDADVRMENYLLSDAGIVFRSVPAFSSVPVEWHNEFLQYVVCVIASETVRATRMLASMSTEQNAEQILLRHLSSLRPELKIGVATPGSVSAFETYWRAHAASDLTLPPFLELFHRQMTLLGQYHADISVPSDLIVESLWAVLGRILRFRFGKNLTAETAGEWMMSSSLLAMASVRHLAMSLDEEQASDLTPAADYQPGRQRFAAVIGHRTATVVPAVIVIVFSALLVWLGFQAITPAARFLFSAAILLSMVMAAILISRVE